MTDAYLIQQLLVTVLSDPDLQLLLDKISGKLSHDLIWFEKIKSSYCIKSHVNERTIQL